MKKTRTFKSGNSVAVRLPKALGVEPGIEMTVREERGRYIVEPAEPRKRKLNIEKIWGSATGLELIKPEDRVFEDRPLLGSDPDSETPAA
jgi:antitoxin VapB